MRLPRLGVRIILGAVFWLSAQAGLAQDSLWSANYGGWLNESGNSCLQLSNGDLILFGSTFSYGTGDYDMYLIKTDSTGTVLWQETYGGTATEYGYDIRQTYDGGFILVGSTSSAGAGGRDVYLVRTDAWGTLLWAKTYGGSGNDEGYAIRETADSGLIICGTTASFGSGTDMYVIRTGRNGDSLWTRTYGGTAGESGQGVEVTGDGGYVLIGSTGSFGIGYSSIYLVRTDAGGDTLWTASYGGDRADLGYGVAAINDNGFILTGATVPTGANYYDAYLARVDSSGAVMWEKNYGGSYEDRGYSVALTPDGGCVMAGTREGSGSRKIDVYLVKVDAGGEMEWEGIYGGGESDFCRKIIHDKENDLIALGHTYSASNGGSDVYLLKIRGTQSTPAEWDVRALPSEMIVLKQNYPNPFNMSTWIEYTLPRATSYTLTIYNVLGQTVRRWEYDFRMPGTHTTEWDGTDEGGCVVASGIYLYRIEAGNFSRTRKMILMK